MTDWTSWNDAVLTRSEQIDPPSSPCEDCPFYDECDDADECLKEQADEEARDEYWERLVDEELLNDYKYKA